MSTPEQKLPPSPTADSTEQAALPQPLAIWGFVRIQPPRRRVQLTWDPDEVEPLTAADYPSELTCEC